MRQCLLVDTGPLVALLDRDDDKHSICVEVTKRFPPPFFTTWPVLTEAAYLLGFSREAQDALMLMLERQVLVLAELSASDAPHLRALLRKYGDLPMDLADATLVRVADREGLRDVFTLDRRDFSVYRLSRNRAFTLYP